MTQAFNLSQLANKVNTSGQLDVATGVTGTQAVANGGTGQSTYTDGQLLIGNTTGNTLTKSTLTAGSGISITNGAGSITIANTAGGQLQSQIFTAPGTWTNPGSVTRVQVSVNGGGGGGGSLNSLTQGGGTGGSGGSATALSFTIPTSPVSITVGSGGAGASSGPAPGSPGGSSSLALICQQQVALVAQMLPPQLAMERLEQAQYQFPFNLQQQMWGLVVEQDQGQVTQRP